jgi:hypothetical protein
LIGRFLATRKYAQQAERHERWNISETEQRTPPAESLGRLTSIVPEKWLEAVRMEGIVIHEKGERVMAGELQVRKTDSGPAAMRVFQEC